MKSIAKILGLAGVLLLGSCSKEDSSPLTSSVQSSTASGVYLSGSVGLDEARSLSHTIVKGSSFTQTVNLGVYDLDDSKTVERYKPRASFSGSRSEILFVLKSDNASQPVSYVKVPVTHKDDRSFDIDGSVNVTLAPGTNLSVGNWYALGFVYSSGKSSGQTVSFNETTKRLEITAPSGGTYTASEFDASTETGNTLTAPSVYMFDWMPLQIVTSGGRSTVKLTSRAQLKPQGALFLLEVSNLSMRYASYDESIARRGSVWWSRPAGMQEGDDIWVDRDGNRAYATLNSMTINIPSVDQIAWSSSYGQPVPPAASLDGHFDLSASALDVTRSPKLNMGTTHQMEISYPERRYYYSERHQDKPMYWSAVWMTPNPEASTNSSATITLRTGGVHFWWSSHMSSGVTVEEFFEPNPYQLQGAPRNGSVIYRQTVWGYWWGSQI